MQLYRTSSNKNILKELRPNFYILLQAIPFMMIMFVVIPRLGSFWSVPSPQHAKTGMSDSMSPGDLSELMQSDELAFRVTFNGRVPSHEKLYWRSLVLSNFDGRRWSQNKYQYQQNLNNLRQFNSNLHSHIEYLGERNSYEVIAEPSGRPWLYALAAPQTWSGDIALTRDLRLQAFTPVAQRISYRVTSVLNYRLNEISADELAQNLQLPLKGNKQTRQLAKDWLAETGSPQKLIEKLFRYYNKSFIYTLRPPALGTDPVDEFLFQSRQGFCEHFASSFVFFMRAAGIPARVVIGYQGGDLNSVEGYLAVRQRDAHAWAEVWFENRGWVSMDPTAAVAPERIQKGIEESLSANDQEFLAKPFGSSLKMLMRLYDRIDALNFQWTRWVMNYDSTLQSKLLAKLLSDASPFRIALFALGAGFASLLLVFVILHLRTSKIKLPLTAMLYQQLCKKLNAFGWVPEPGETPRRFTQRIISERPELSLPLGRIMDLYEQLTYAEDVSVLNQLKQELLEFSPKKYI
jgi:transglutaminase-like putative cysteine protease